MYQWMWFFFLQDFGHVEKIGPRKAVDLCVWVFDYRDPTEIGVPHEYYGFSNVDGPIYRFPIGVDMSVWFFI